MQVANKIVVVTGASRGLGLELARQFVEAKAHVVITDIRKQELKKVAEELTVDFVVADVTKPKQLQKVADFVLRKFGQIDIWINNAGIWMPHCAIEDLNFIFVKKMLDVNLLGTMIGSRLALLQMKRQRFGMIININSISGLSGRPFSAGYCSTKWAVRGFTKSLRKEVAEWGIKVVEIYPDKMKTHLFDKDKPKSFKNMLDPEAVAQQIIKNIGKQNPKEELTID